MVTLARSGNSAPRQRRGRNGLIGVSANSGASIGNDRPLHREIIGGRAGRRRQQHAVGDELGEAFLAVDQDAQPRRLVALPEQRHFVDGAVAVDAAGGVARAHQQRMDDADMGGRKPFGEAVLGKLVHQEADRAAVHAIDRLAGIHEPLQGRQHEAVAAERDDDVGGLRPGVAVAANEPAAGLLRRRHVAGDEGDALET